MDSIPGGNDKASRERALTQQPLPPSSYSGGLNSPPIVPPITRRGEAADATAPDGSEIRLLIGKEHLIDGASMVEVVLPGGQVSRSVYHRRVEEIWFILDGKGRVWRCPPNSQDPAAVNPQEVEAGDALTIPTGWRFQFAAERGCQLRFLCVTAPPWPGPEEALPADYGGLGPATV